jgi:hypothetical protein
MLTTTPSLPPARRAFAGFSLTAFAFLAASVFAIAAPTPTIQEPYPPVSGAFSGAKVQESPDPMVAYRWATPKATDNLEIYTLSPVTAQADKPENALIQKDSIHVTGDCDLMFDF